MFAGRHEHRVEEEQEDEHQPRMPRRHVQTELHAYHTVEGHRGPTDTASADPGWDPSIHHGDTLREKRDKCTRVLSVQFNTFPTNNTDEDKAKRLMLEALLRTTDADIMVSQEDNVAWDLITADRRPKEICRQWFESLQVHSAYNTHEQNTERRTHLRGGVSIWSMNDATHRVLARGVDTSGLGRWCYV